jgi:hypothetical protein
MGKDTALPSLHGQLPERVVHLPGSQEGVPEWVQPSRNPSLPLALLLFKL